MLISNAMPKVGTISTCERVKRNPQSEHNREIKIIIFE